MILFCLSRILEFANCTTSWFHISNSISIFSNFIPFLFLSFRVVRKNCSSLLIRVAWKSQRCNIRKHFVFRKRDKGWKEERGSNHKVLGKKGATILTKKRPRIFQQRIPSSSFFFPPFACLICARDINERLVTVSAWQSLFTAASIQSRYWV